MRTPVFVLIILLVLTVVGSGVGYRGGNNALAGVGGLVGLILLLLLIMFAIGDL